MKKIFIIFLSIYFSQEISHAQLPNHNMQFLANLNQHITNDTYSGCWGYVDSAGNEYAILGTHLGTAFIDITNSANIHEVDFAPAPVSGSGNHWREITVYSHYAYVVTEQANSGIEIFDLRYLPDSVHRVNRFILPNHITTHTISVSGSYLYLNGANASFGQGITILDLSINPELPVVRGSLNTHYVHDCRVINDTIWAACLSNGIRIINAVNKDQPVFLNSFTTPPHNATHNSALTKDRKYIYTTDETSTPTAGTLKIYDIQDLNNITFVRDWRPTNITASQVHNIEIYGDTAVIAHRSAGIRVLDISNPVDPVEIAWYDTFPLNNNNAFTGCWGVYMFPSKKIIGSNKEDGLWVVQLGTPSPVVINNSIADKYSLYQNYPNPFNPVTHLGFGISEFGLVSLKVYDALGKDIAVLVNEKLSPGIYETEFDGSNYPSGIYFYTLATENFSDTKRMILLK
ncbi:MAG: choice-of-anchor B family protein [Ignavibacteria bacterium]|nr:choice-of-anchor B family protein [Ignavibacteria bacterium]